MQEKKEKLSELFKLLKENYTPITPGDLHLQIEEEIYKPDDDQPNICCDQIIIYWQNGKYVLCDLYNSHPNIEFTSPEEVLEFYDGYTNGVGCNVEDLRENAVKLTLQEKAYNVGRYRDAVDLISITKKYFEEVVCKEQKKFER